MDHDSPLNSLQSIPKCWGMTGFDWLKWKQEVIEPNGEPRIVHYRAVLELIVYLASPQKARDEEKRARGPKWLTWYFLPTRVHLESGFTFPRCHFVIFNLKLFFAGMGLSDFQAAYNLRVQESFGSMSHFIRGDLENGSIWFQPFWGVLYRSCGFFFGQTTFSPFLHLASSHLAFGLLVRNSRGHFSLPRFFEMIAP